MSTTHILDLRGLLLKTYHGSEDQSVAQGACWQAALIDFMDTHLLPLLKHAAPRQIIVVLDKGNTYRRNLWQDYKQARRAEVRDPATEQETKELQERAQELLVYLGAKIMWVPGEEADDVIALLCQKLAGPKIVYTVDADLLALVNENTQVLRAGKLYAQPALLGVVHSVPYALVSLNKALVGDSSDGYRGVPGLGEKAWESLLATYGEPGMQWLAAILEADDPAPLQPYTEVDPQLAKVYANWPDARRCWLLANLHPDACYGSYRTNSGKTLPKRPEWRVRLPSRERVANVLSDALRMTTTAVIFDAQLGQYLENFERFFLTERLITANDAGELVTLLPEILASEVVAYDFESSDKLQHAPFRQASTKDFVDVLAQELAGISINWGDNSQHTIYISFDHADTANLNRDWATWLLQSLSAREERCVVHNASFELTVTLRNLGFMPRAPFDTQILSSYCDENEEAGLKALSQRVLNYRQTSYAEVTGGRAMWEVPAVDVVSYGCDDSLVTAHLFDLFKTIMHLEGSWDFYDKYEVSPAADDVYSFVAGTRIDLDRLAELRAASAERREQAELALRTALAEHPGDERQAQQAATTLLAEYWAVEQFKYVDDPAAGQESYQALWQRAWQACFYTPPVAITASKPFAATPTGINTVIALIDPRAPKLKSLSVKEIEQYDDLLADYLAPLSSIDRAVIDLRELANLLHGARQWLKPGKRSGNNYERLRDFCQGILDEKAPVKVTASGSTLNFGSAPQMAQFLYGLLGLPIRRRSKVVEGTFRAKHGLSGSPATGLKAAAAAIVWDLQEGDWRIEVLHNYATVCKEQQLESLYYKKYPLWVSPIDGRIHPQQRNCGTATRRPAGSSPNILQVASGPMRTMFSAGEGRVFVSLDVSSQEILIAACTSKDPIMLDAFMQNPRLDIHSLTASGIAPVLLPRMGVPWNGPMSYEQFVSGLHSDDEKVKAAHKNIRKRYAKACIAEGSPVLTDRGCVPIEQVEITDLVWDGVEWVWHEGVIFKGIQEVITYDGLTATRDHVVYLQHGEKQSLGEAMESASRPRLAVGERHGQAVRFSEGNFRGLLSEAGRAIASLCDNALRGLWEGAGQAYGESGLRENTHMPLQPQEVYERSNGAPGGQVPGDQAAMRQSELRGLPLLWWAGYTKLLHVGRAICSLHNFRASARGLLRFGDRSGRQQWPLRAREFALSYSGAEYGEYQTDCVGGVPRNEDAKGARMAPTEAFSPGVSLHKLNCAETVTGLRSGRGGPVGIPKAVLGREKVYDIVNAGPRHRFTVSGKIVANCNFGVIYGSSAVGLAENMMIEKREAETVYNAFMSMYSRIGAWQAECSDFARQHGYVLMPFGTRRHAEPDLWSDERKLSGRQERQLGNSCIQGAAAEMLKVMRQGIFDHNMRERYRMESTFFVYDEITSSVPVELAKDYILELAEIMRIQAPGFEVAMDVEAAIGPTWGSQVEVGIPTPENIDRALKQLEEST